VAEHPILQAVTCVGTLAEHPILHAVTCVGTLAEHPILQAVTVHKLTTLSVHSAGRTALGTPAATLTAHISVTEC
jgi:hypothetical protein